MYSLSIAAEYIDYIFILDAELHVYTSGGEGKNSFAAPSTSS